MYEAKYPSKGDPALASIILNLLSSAGIKSEGVRRGLDHGVWAGFHVGECEEDSGQETASEYGIDDYQHSTRLRTPSTFPWSRCLFSNPRTRTSTTALGRPSLLSETRVWSLSAQACLCTTSEICGMS